MACTGQVGVDVACSDGMPVSKWVYFDCLRSIVTVVGVSPE